MISLDAPTHSNGAAAGADGAEQSATCRDGAAVFLLMPSEERVQRRLFVQFHDRDGSASLVFDFNMQLLHQIDRFRHLRPHLRSKHLCFPARFV